MVSTIILSPASGAVVSAAQDMTVAVKTQGINLGFFEDPNTRYYTSPQTLDKAGNIEGHQHVTIQALGSAQAPPNPQTQALAFFKGLDQATNNGILTVTVPAGSMKPGLTRICTMTGGRGHQAVLMPVARRGAQDDCIRITVQ
ncbi:hypothetical protein BC828DRAFT_384162 [Blastocladiella britannica]|nr:hypothetical protein BC828DRAFT_384162 [Blastocladiella britannica]